MATSIAAGTAAIVMPDASLHAASPGDVATSVAGGTAAVCRLSDADCFFACSSGDLATSVAAGTAAVGRLSMMHECLS